MCIERKTVLYAPDAGPIVLDIEAGFATKGKFKAFLRTEEWSEFGGGDIADDVPDVLVVPLDGAALDGRRVLILGKYAPAFIPTGQQIKVTYTLLQDQTELARSVIEEERAGVLICTHTYIFEALEDE